MSVSCLNYHLVTLLQMLVGCGNRIWTKRLVHCCRRGSRHAVCIGAVIAPALTQRILCVIAHQNKPHLVALNAYSYRHLTRLIKYDFFWTYLYDFFTLLFGPIYTRSTTMFSYTSQLVIRHWSIKLDYRYCS